MRGFRETQKGPMPLPFRKDVEAEMRELIDGDGCMRRVLDTAMDGRDDGLDCREGVEKCQRCQALVDDEEEEEEDCTQEDADRAEFEQQMLTRRALQWRRPVVKREMPCRWRHWRR